MRSVSTHSTRQNQGLSDTGEICLISIDRCHEGKIKALPVVQKQHVSVMMMFFFMGPLVDTTSWLLVT